MGEQTRIDTYTQSQINTYTQKHTETEIEINYQELYYIEREKREHLERILEDKNREITKLSERLVKETIKKQQIEDINGETESNQSQKHGFTFENEIRTKVFKLQPKGNDRNIYDILHQDNLLDLNENISIKTTGSKTICCGDILRFYNYDFNKRNTIIVIKYIQSEENKVIQNIYEIDYNKECHKLLFGNLTEDKIKTYVEGVKSIPRNIKGEQAKKIYDYLVEKKKLTKECNNIIQINPKVDSQQSRVQCSITNFETILRKFITYKSTTAQPNLIRGVKIINSIESCKRRRNQFKIQN